MTDPLPEKEKAAKVPSYNRMAPPKRWRKYNPFAEPDSLEGYYSAFLPLLIVFLAFILLLVYEVWFLRYKALNLVQQNDRLVETLQKAKTQNDFVEGLHKDLQTLASTDPTAASLLKEYFPEPPPTTSDQPSKSPAR